MSKYRHNHYVPIWYQQRFILRGQHRYWRLDLFPEVVKHAKGSYKRRDIHEWSPENIFAEDDLYTSLEKWDINGHAKLQKFSQQIVPTNVWTYLWFIVRLRSAATNMPRLVSSCFR